MTGGAPILLDPSVSSDALDPTETVELLLRDLKTGRDGLSSREAQRRLVQFGPNELSRRGGRRWPRELARQFTHPLALLLVAAAGLAWVAGIVAVALAIVVVILINAAFAFVQEMQAERAVEALAAVPAGSGQGGPRRSASGDRGARAGAGRCVDDRGGRAHLRRRTPAERRDRGRRLDADRRVDAGVPRRGSV